MNENNNNEVPAEEEKDDPNKTVRNKINYLLFHYIIKIAE